MKRVVLESPYAGDIERNVEYARQCVRNSVTRGEAPIASHLLFTQPGILCDHIAAERKLGIEAGLAWISQADAMVVYSDYGISKGMQDAIERAEVLGVPIEYRLIK